MFAFRLILGFALSASTHQFMASSLGDHGVVRLCSPPNHRFTKLYIKRAPGLSSRTELVQVDCIHCWSTSNSELPQKDDYTRSKALCLSVMSFLWWFFFSMRAVTGGKHWWIIESYFHLVVGTKFVRLLLHLVADKALTLMATKCNLMRSIVRNAWWRIRYGGRPICTALWIPGNIAFLYNILVEWVNGYLWLIYGA